MGRLRSKSPPKKSAGTTQASSPCTSPRKRDEAKEERKEDGGARKTKAVATVPTPPHPPRVTKSKATGDANKNAKRWDNQRATNTIFLMSKI